jgi:uncharacterized protein with PIN domain
MAREDTLLLEIATRDKRLLLTRDRELARRAVRRRLLRIRRYHGADSPDRRPRPHRAPGPYEPLLESATRILRPATAREVREARYAPQADREREFSWCPVCRKLYWMGSHGEHIEERLRESFSP